MEKIEFATLKRLNLSGLVKNEEEAKELFEEVLGRFKFTSLHVLKAEHNHIDEPILLQLLSSSTCLPSLEVLLLAYNSISNIDLSSITDVWMSRVREYQCFAFKEKPIPLKLFDFSENQLSTNFRFGGTAIKNKMFKDYFQSCVIFAWRTKRFLEGKYFKYSIEQDIKREEDRNMREQMEVEFSRVILHPSPEFI